MNRETSLVLSSEHYDYRRVAQLNWGLSDEQMMGKHVHHHPPRSEGGRNIPEHLYVCSPEMHEQGWHRCKEFPKLASEGGRLSAITRRRKAEELKKLPKEEQKRLKEERRIKREDRKKFKGRKTKFGPRNSSWKYRETLWHLEIPEEEYENLLNQLLDEGLLFK